MLGTLNASNEFGRTGAALLIKSASILICLLAPVQAYAQPKPVSHYRSIFDEIYETNNDSIDSAMASGVGATYYNQQYIWMGILAMFEATGDEAYLDQALAWGESAISAATIRDADGYLHWSGPHEQFGTPGIAYYLHVTQGSTELARMARLVLTNPDLKAKYGDRAQKIADFLKHHYIERRWAEIEAWRNDLCAAERPLSDKPIMTARILLDLYDIFQIDLYKILAADTMECFKARWESYRGGFIWDGKYIPTDAAVDTSHANRMPVMMIDFYERGLIITRDDLDRLAILFTDVIWNGSETDPLFSNYIDGSNSDYRGKGPYTNGFVYAGWADLASYDCAQYRAIDAVMQALIDGRSNPSVARNNTKYGWMALSGKLAKAASSGQCGEPPSAPDEPPAPIACHRFDSSEPIPSDWGAAFDVLSAANELLLRPDCTSSGATVRIGNGANIQYIYKYGYEWRNNGWKRVTYTGSQENGDWIIGEATAALPRTWPEMLETNYFVAYVCTWTGRWACGCSNSACTESYWQLQSFLLEPEAPSEDSLLDPTG